VVGDVELPTKQILIRFVIGLREVDTRRITTCNNNIRGMNSLQYAREESHLTTRGVGVGFAQTLPRLSALKHSPAKVIKGFW
jgi:hypothetical protein